MGFRRTRQWVQTASTGRLSASGNALTRIRFFQRPKKHNDHTSGVHTLELLTSKGTSITFSH